MGMMARMLRLVSWNHIFHAVSLTRASRRRYGV